MNHRTHGEQSIIQTLISLKKSRNRKSPIFILKNQFVLPSCRGILTPPLHKACLQAHQCCGRFFRFPNPDQALWLIPAEKRRMIMPGNT